MLGGGGEGNLETEQFLDFEKKKYDLEKDYGQQETLERPKKNDFYDDQLLP